MSEMHAIDIAAEGVDNATGVGFLTYLTPGEFDQFLPRKAMTTATTE